MHNVLHCLPLCYTGGATITDLILKNRRSPNGAASRRMRTHLRMPPWFETPPSAAPHHEELQ
jgi:hypothetical protein